MTARQKVGWKVVDKSRRSSVVFDGYAARHYPKRRKVTPANNCGPLCVFKIKKAALRFTGNNNISRVKKCLYIPSKSKRIWDDIDSLCLETLPSHTALADSVTCLE